MAHREWLTATIADRHPARRCVGRLSSGGFEYRVELDGQQLRVLVPSLQIGEVLDLLSTLEN